MAQTKTSIDAAVDRNTRSISLASTSGLAVGDRLVIGREIMQVNEIPVAGNARVQRGMEGTAARAHAADEGAIFGAADDFVIGPGDTRIVDGKGIQYTAAGPLLHTPGIHRVNGTTLAMTLAVPSADDEGLQMTISAENASAHTLTVAGGVDGGGSSFDVGTFGGALGDKVTVGVVNALWTILDNVNVTIA